MKVEGELIEIERDEEKVTYFILEDMKYKGIITLSAPYCDDEDKRKRVTIE